MRARLSEGLLGVGGIFMAFGVTVIIIGLFARMNTNTQAEFPAIVSLATLFVLSGAVLFAAGYLVGRMGRRETTSAQY